MTTIDVIDLIVKAAIASYAYFIFDTLMDSFFNYFLGPDWRERLKRYKQ